MDDGLALAVHRGRSKIRFEMTNEDGDKIVLIFEGRISREKLMQVADLMELYGGLSEFDRQEHYFEGSKLAKLARVISKYFPVTYFTSREAVEAYISEYREPISLSTTSTYLARLSERGFLERRRFGGVIRYRVIRHQPQIPDEERYTQRFELYDRKF